MLEEHELSIEPGQHNTVRLPSIIPKLSETPGATQWLGPTLGSHNEEIYRQLLAFTPEKLAQWQQNGMI